MIPVWCKRLAGCLVLTASLLSPLAALAGDDLDVTMRMVTDDAALTESVVREIQLDRPIGLVDNPGRATETAKNAREQGRDFGQAAAERAKEAARLRRDTRAQAKSDSSGPNEPGNSGGGPN